MTVKAVDENSNPVTLNKDNITYSVAGVNGRFEGNKFIPTSSGKALIIASYDGVEVGTEIIVSEKPQGIRIEPSNLQVDEVQKLYKFMALIVKGISCHLQQVVLHGQVITIQ